MLTLIKRITYNGYLKTKLFSNIGLLSFRDARIKVEKCYCTVYKYILFVCRNSGVCNQLNT